MAFGEGLRERVRRVLATRAVFGVAGLTVLLTCAFVGVLAFASPGMPDVGDRLVYYVFVTALVFVVAVLRLDDRDREGLSVLSAVTAVAVVTFLLVSLAAEGVVYAVQNPGELVASQIVLYFAAAALICTGVGMWALRHWREFAAG